MILRTKSSTSCHYETSQKAFVLKKNCAMFSHVGATAIITWVKCSLFLHG